MLLHSQDLKKAMATRRFLVVEGIYMNTGDLAPLKKLVCKTFKLPFNDADIEEMQIYMDAPRFIFYLIIFPSFHFPLPPNGQFNITLPSRSS